MCVAGQIKLILNKIQIVLRSPQICFWVPFLSFVFSEWNAQDQPDWALAGCSTSLPSETPASLSQCVLGHYSFALRGAVRSTLLHSPESGLTIYHYVLTSHHQRHLGDQRHRPRRLSLTMMRFGSRASHICSCSGWMCKCSRSVIRILPLPRFHFIPSISERSCFCFWCVC